MNRLLTATVWLGILAAFHTSSLAQCPSPVGEQRTLVLLANFVDESSEPFPREAISEIVLNASNPDSVNAYIQEVSYGNAWVTGAVLDWVTVPVNAADCGSYFDVATIGNLLDLSGAPGGAGSYGRFVIVHPLNEGGASCPQGSTSTLGPLPLSTSEGPVCASLMRVAVSASSLLETTHARTLVHELGHSLGVSHAQDLECARRSVGDVPQVCEVSSAGRDRYDIMGQVGLRGHYNAIFKEALGWIEPGAVRTVGVLPSSVAIDPLEVPTTGVHAVRVPAVYELDGERASTHYYVTYRQAIGEDAIFSELADPTTGVMIRLNSTGPGLAMESALVDTTPNKASATLAQLDDSADVSLSLGETYADRRHGLSISFSDVAAGSAVVTVDSLSSSAARLAKCKDAKARAAGRRAFDLLQAFARNRSNPNAARLGAHVARAQAAFTKSFSQAEPGGCRTIGDAGGIGAKVDALVADVLQSASP
jgi:hypothetical protein